MVAYRTLVQEDDLELQCSGRRELEITALCAPQVFRCQHRRCSLLFLAES